MHKHRPIRLALIAACACLAAVLAACDASATAVPPDGAPAPTAAVITPTAMPAPTSTPAPSATKPPAPSATPRPAPAPRLTQLTKGGCCTQPFWSPDSRQILFIDKPGEDAPSGIYAVDVNAPATPKLFTERVAYYTADLQYVTTVDAVYATIERLSDGQKFRIRSGGRNVLISPDRTKVVWSETPQNGPNETRVTQIMGANLDGSEARPIVALLRGGVSGWLDNDRLLVTARSDPKSQAVSLFTYSLTTGARPELARSERLRASLPSPGGNWIVYTINFDADPQKNGVWLVSSDGATRRKLDFFGSFQWRDRDRLIYVPLEMGEASHAFREYDARTDTYRALTDPADAPFKIANGDWSIAPDGKQIVFLNAKDGNLWLWNLAP